MENAHRENIKNLFRWWNGHVFSFESVPGTSRKDDDGYDSGMDAAVAALRSDEEFSDEDNIRDDWTTPLTPAEELQADQPLAALQMNTSTDGHHDPQAHDISINFIQLTISEHDRAAPSESNPVVAPSPVHAVAVPRVRYNEPTLAPSHSTGAIITFRSFAQ